MCFTVVGMETAGKTSRTRHPREIPLPQRSLKTQTFLSMGVVYCVRWLVSLGVAMLVFVLAAGSAASSENGFWGQFSFSSAASLVRVAFAFILALSVTVSMNAFLSALAIIKFAEPGNRLWAFALMFTMPLLTAGVMSAFMPLSSMVTPGVILFCAAAIDLATMLFIAWRIYLKKSPFAKYKLVDSSEYQPLI